MERKVQTHYRYEIDDEDILYEYIRKVINIHYPCSSDQTSGLTVRNNIKVNIFLSETNLKTYVNFTKGKDFKWPVPTDAKVPYYIQNSEIFRIISYLVSVRGFNFGRFDSSEKSLVIHFNNFYDQTHYDDLGVGEIDLGLYFEREKTKNLFLGALIKRYYRHNLTGVDKSTMADMKEKYFSELTKEEMIDFVSSMGSYDLLKMLKSIDDDTFYRYVSSSEYKERVHKRRTNKS